MDSNDSILGSRVSFHLVQVKSKHPKAMGILCLARNEKFIVVLFAAVRIVGFDF